MSLEKFFESLKVKVGNDLDENSNEERCETIKKKVLKKRAREEIVSSALKHMLSDKQYGPEFKKLMELHAQNTTTFTKENQHISSKKFLASRKRKLPLNTSLKHGDVISLDLDPLVYYQQADLKKATILRRVLSLDFNAYIAYGPNKEVLLVSADPSIKIGKSSENITIQSKALDCQGKFVILKPEYATLTEDDNVNSGPYILVTPIEKFEISRPEIFSKKYFLCQLSRSNVKIEKSTCFNDYDIIQENTLIPVLETNECAIGTNVLVNALGCLWKGEVAKITKTSRGYTTVEVKYHKNIAASLKNFTKVSSDEILNVNFLESFRDSGKISDQNE